MSIAAAWSISFEDQQSDRDRWNGITDDTPALIAEALDVPHKSAPRAASAGAMTTHGGHREQ